MDTVKEIKNVCDSCKANHKDPDSGSCFDDSVDAVKSVMMNVATIAIGYLADKPRNGVVVDGQVKRSLSESFVSKYLDPETGEVKTIEGNSPLHGSVLAWSKIHGYEVLDHETTLAKRDDENENPTDYVHFKMPGSNKVRTLVHRAHNNTCGTLGYYTDFSSNSTNSTTLAKRSNPSLYPLCSGYVGTDYCANQDQWGGFYSSNELDTQIKELVKKSMNDESEANYFKMYSAEQDDETEDWQLSFRMYYDTGRASGFYFSSCDTGY